MYVCSIRMLISTVLFLTMLVFSFVFFPSPSAVLAPTSKPRAAASIWHLFVLWCARVACHCSREVQVLRHID